MDKRFGATSKTSAVALTTGTDRRGMVYDALKPFKVVLAGTDWLAVDRIGVELMGIDYRRVIYLRWCGQAGMGQDDRAKIEIIGPDPAKYVKTYKLHRNIAEQLAWIEQDKI